MKQRITIATATVAAVLSLSAGLASAGARVSVKNGACPSALNAGTVDYHCTLSGSGGPATVSTAMHLKGSKISGSMKLRIHGHTYSFSIGGPIGTNKAHRVVFNGRYHGSGGSGTVQTIAPPNQPTAPSQFIVKGSL